jgi:hypothetical protein
MALASGRVQPEIWSPTNGLFGSSTRRRLEMVFAFAGGRTQVLKVAKKIRSRVKRRWKTAQNIVSASS